MAKCRPDYYLKIMIFGAVVGAMYGFIIADTQGEFVEDAPRDDLDGPLKPNTTSHLTSTGGKWVGGGTGVGAAACFLCLYLYRNLDIPGFFFELKKTLTNAYSSLSQTKQGDPSRSPSNSNK